jgi:hypothetical protein
MERLGQAITLRREYLRYCSEHQGRFKEDIIEDQGDKIDKNTLPETFASSVVTEQLEQTESQTVFDDTQSQASSYDSSIGIGEEGFDSKLHLPKLGDVNGGKREFECPYCHIAVKIEQHGLWKYVVSICRPRTYQTDYMLQEARLS